MRWLMLPVSALAHAAAFAACVVLPFFGDLETPAPWRNASARTFIAAAPVPPPPPSGPVLHKTIASDRYAAPRSAPDRIEAEVPLPPAGIASDAIEGGAGGANAVPGGMSLDDFTPPATVVVAPPAPVKPTAYRTGGAIREPRKIHHVPAVYPEFARAARVEGVVILEATIDERGVVSGARVLKSVPLLDQAALSALRQWRYTPTLLNGVPVPVLMTVTFRFSLSDVHL
jgi:periplasmic protein TonB